MRRRRKTPLHIIIYLSSFLRWNCITPSTPYFTVSLLNELSNQGAVLCPLDQKSATGWIHNPVIADKRYGDKIWLTLDTLPMTEAVKTAKFPIPTLMLLRNKLKEATSFPLWT